MPECVECGTFIQSGRRCQQCALEHQHGSLADRRDDCTVCETTIDSDEPTKTVDGQTAHAECGGQARCDGGWRVEQQGLDGEPAQGQATLDGGVAKDGGGD